MVVRRYTCALLSIHPRDPDPTRKMRTEGTGTLVQFNGRRFILTAHHVVERGLDNFCLPLREKGPHLLPLRGLRISSDVMHDTALIHLPDDDRFRALDRGWRFLRLASPPATLPDERPFFLFGFPADEGRVTIGMPDSPSQSGAHAQVTLRSHRIVLTLGRTTGPKEIHDSEPVDPRIDFFLDHPTEGRRFGAREAERFPDIRGISGCGVWVLLPPPALAVPFESRLSFTGIETGFGSGGGKWIRCRRVDAAIELLSSMIDNSAHRHATSP